MLPNIKEYRKEKGFTQETLSKKSGVSRSIISGLETGRISVTTTLTMKKISNALEEKVEDVFFSQKV